MQSDFMSNNLSAYSFSFDASKCESCGGKCCTGESGYVFVTYDELLLIAKFLNLDIAELISKYCKKVGYRYSLIEKLNEDATNAESSLDLACIFFDTINKNCSIYQVRPKQCKTFPFWEAHKSDKLNNENLKKLQQECKGIYLK